MFDESPAPSLSAPTLTDVAGAGPGRAPVDLPAAHPSRSRAVGAAPSKVGGAPSGVGGASLALADHTSPTHAGAVGAALDDTDGEPPGMPRLEDDPLAPMFERGDLTASCPATPDADELPEWSPSAEAAALLADADLGLMTDRELVETVALWGRIVAWAQAQQMRAAAELDARPAMRPTWSPRAGRVAQPRVTAEELAARLGCSRHAAQLLVRDGRSFEGALAPTGDALADGQIDAVKARVLVKALDEVALEVAVLVQEEVLPVAPRMTPRRLAEHVEEVLLRVDPVDAEHRAARAAAARRVDRPTVRPDGMAGLSAVLPAPAAVAVHAELDLVARDLRDAGDERTLDQLRADVLVTAVLARHIPNAEPSPSATADSGTDGTVLHRTALHRTALHRTALHRTALHRTAHHLATTPVRAHVQVTVPLDVLLGASEEPADLDGYGAIHPAAARALARGGTWRRLVTDPLSGMVHDVGRTRYAPPPDIARHVRARDRTCAAPWCSAPARSCELDHTIPFGDPASARATDRRTPTRRSAADDLTTRTAEARPTSSARDRPTGTADDGTRAAEDRRTSTTDESPTSSVHGTRDKTAADGRAPRGRTATDNLGPLCKRDHLLKTHAGFGLVQDAPGVFTWTTPSGQRIRRDPRPVARPAGPPPSTPDQLRTVRTYVAEALGQPVPARDPARAPDPDPNHTGTREDSPPF